MVLGAMVYVPVVGEVAALILFIKSAAELTVNCATAVAKDLDSLFLNDYFKTVFEYYQRLAETAKEDAENVYAVSRIIKSGKDEGSVPALFRVRAAVLTGLVRLIDRCGTRYNDKEAFEKKVKQYDIAGYIDTFIFNFEPSTEIVLSTFLPLDELWLYLYGCKAGLQADTMMRAAGAAVRSIPVLDVSRAIIGKSKTVPYQKVLLNYQKNFPLHQFTSGDPVKLAKTFCIDYSGVDKGNIAFTAAYYYDEQDNAWHMLPGTKMIHPFRNVRIVVVLKPSQAKPGEKQEDLTGLPLSLRLVRTDGLDVDGPVYKALAIEMVKSEKNEGRDKGLLETPEEKPFISNETQKYYGYVFHPFYYWDGKIETGIKPFGFIKLEKLPGFDLELRLKTGKIDKVISVDNKSQTNIRVYLPTQRTFPLAPIMVDMITNDAFLGNKSSDAVYNECFSSLANVHLSGYLIRRNNALMYSNAGKHGLLSREEAPLTAGYQFDFSWESPFEIIFLFTADFIQKWWSEKDTINFPLQVTCSEDGDEGPTYRSEAYALKSKAFITNTLTIGALKEYLVEHRIIDVSDKIGNPGEPFFSYSNNYQQYIFAAKVKFNYDVEDAKNEMIQYNGFKPFSKQYISASEDKKYEVTFKIAAPQKIGLQIDHSAKFYLPGLPKQSSKRPFLTNKNFVTKETVRPLTSIQTPDYH